MNVSIIKVRLLGVDGVKTTEKAENQSSLKPSIIAIILLRRRAPLIMDRKAVKFFLDEIQFNVSRIREYVDSIEDLVALTRKKMCEE